MRVANVDLKVLETLVARSVADTKRRYPKPIKTTPNAVLRRTRLWRAGEVHVRRTGRPLSDESSTWLDVFESAAQHPLAADGGWCHPEPPRLKPRGR